MGYVWVNDDESAREAVRIAREAAEDVAVALRNKLVEKSPRDSGRLANSWAIDVEVQGTRVVASVYSNVKPDSTPKYLWELHHEGTGRHGPVGRDIVPVRRKALRWRGGRGVASPKGPGYVFAKSSQGIRPNRFIETAIRETMAQFPGWQIRIASPPGTRVPR
jgi:hypothetical protein